MLFMWRVIVKISITHTARKSLCKGHCLHNTTQKITTSVLSAGFEFAIPAIERPRTYAEDRVARKAAYCNRFFQLFEYVSVSDKLCKTITCQQT